MFRPSVSGPFSPRSPAPARSRLFLVPALPALAFALLVGIFWAVFTPAAGAQMLPKKHAANRIPAQGAPSSTASRFGLSPFQPASSWSAASAPLDAHPPSLFQPPVRFGAYALPPDAILRSDATGAPVSAGAERLAGSFPAFGSGLGMDTERGSRSGAAEWPWAPRSAGQPDATAPLFSIGPPDARSAFGVETSPSRAPSFNDLMHGNLNTLRASPFESGRPPQRTFLPGTAFSDTFQPPPLSALITSDLGNGVLFSAGANSSRNLPGSPAAGFGPTAGPKRPGASVGLKLSF